mmetsp:Transcript_3147/g.3756  ORF Transcript_3147/g.3756 Transcript_3147/m.3756 type:complete len:403 (-) Transcript_3147:160-1368(-)
MPAKNQKPKNPKANQPKPEDSDENKTSDELTDATLTKYREAGRIANSALELVLKACVVGKKIVELCEAGDAYITGETDKIYNKKTKAADAKVATAMEKGIGFPTCISVNAVVGHYSPEAGNEVELAAGDVVKIDLGAHIDGYLAVAAQTIVVGEEVTEGRKADVIEAARVASELALRMLKPGGTSKAMSDMLEQVAGEFNCTQVQGIVSHQISQFTIDGEKVIVNKPDPESKVDDVEFEPNEVYAIDIVMSTGDGKTHADDDKPTVFKRSRDERYNLRRPTSKNVLSEVDKRFPTFPFTIRALAAKNVRFGLKEMLEHDLVTAYPILHEKPGEIVAHFKFTALVMPQKTLKLTGVPFQGNLQPAESLKDEALIALLATSVGKKKRKKKKKKKAAKPAAEASA